ncbi:ABC-2 type transport system permease protein [Conyzicola lurida]|uniref:Transport permease protein n=1 Tax=Conyzicola lurida TaxID=1172621 RepID=A0A841APL1_9MICO|nr:ABC-2 type transport system permease protein [Conyzicola lurida]
MFSSRELLANLTLREVRGKYKRTIFGQLWSLANPLALVVIYTIVFAFILRVEPDRGDPSGLNVFAVWLLCGLLPWTFFANVVSAGAGSLVANAGLIQKVSFSRIVLPLSLVGSSFYNWLFEMGVLVVLLLIIGGLGVLPWLPLVVVIMVLLAVFASGVALMLAIANVYFRDTQYFLSIILQIWMYLTPIIYPGSLVKTQSDKIGYLFGSELTVEFFYNLNPMVHFLEVFRNLMYDQRFPGLEEWVICLLWAAVSLVIGIFVFQRNERKLAEAL